MEEIVLKNPKIIKFFHEHEDMDPDITILYFIEFLEKLGDNISEKMTLVINTQILSSVLELKQKNQAIYDNINKINTDITNSLCIKMHDIKKEYIEDIKMVIASNTNEKIASILEKNNSLLIDKTALVLNNIIPKSNQLLHNHIDEQIKTFQRTISEDTSKVLKSLDKENIDLKEYFSLFEQKFGVMFQNIVSPINTNIQTQDKLCTELSDFLNKYRLNSSYKGQAGETQLCMVLNKMFPTAEIINTTGQKASGDFLLKRDNKPNIIFENKDYEENVYIDEIRKFIRDIETQNTHGIFLSQKSGIASRSNYQIEFHKGNILVFIHNVEYSKEKIQIAVDIIDNLSVKLNEVSSDEETNNISNDILEEINKEYQNFAIQKDNLIGILKESNKKSLLQVEELKFPTLDHYLSNKFASTANVTKLTNRFKCDMCNFTTNTLKSLSAHKRAHKSITQEPKNIVLDINLKNK